jgi:DNA-binding NarL/FixJ family response regulator
MMPTPNRSAVQDKAVATVRILLADDHTVVRQGLRKVLEERPDWKVVAEAGDGREAVRQAEQLKPDVAVLDVAMPLLNGVEATRQIVKHVPGVRVLVLSMHADEAYVRLMLDDYVKQRSGEPGIVDRYETLSDREREVFQLIAEGKTNKDIAALLFISPSTVETHRARILEKLDVHSAAEIVLYAVRRGVIR